jgi:hypothetical protein
MSIGTAAAKAGPIKPALPITPAEAWIMVGRLKIGLEYRQETKSWIATFRNRSLNIFLPVVADTAFGAVTELLSEIGVEVAHG